MAKKNDGTKATGAADKGAAADKGKAKTKGSESPVFFDTVARWRAAAVVPASSIPKAPNLPALTGDMKRPMLKMAESQRAEARAVLIELRDKGAQLRTDLGTHAPDPSEAARHLSEMDEIRAGKIRADALATFFNDKEDTKSHDVMTFVLAAKEELLHELRHNPGVGDEYPALMDFMVQRRDAILEGRARAGETAQAVQAAAAGGEESPAGKSGTPGASGK